MAVRFVFFLLMNLIAFEKAFCQAKEVSLPELDHMLLVSHGSVRGVEFSMVWGADSIGSQLQLLDDIDFDDLSETVFQRTGSFINEHKKYFLKVHGSLHLLIVDGLMRKYVFSFRAGQDAPKRLNSLIKFSRFLDTYSVVRLSSQQSSWNFTLTGIEPVKSRHYLNSPSRKRKQINVAVSHKKPLLYGSLPHDEAMIAIEEEVDYLKGMLSENIRRYLEVNMPETKTLLQRSNDVLETAKIFKKRTRKLKYDQLIPSCCISSRTYDSNTSSWCDCDQYDFFENIESFYLECCYYQGAD